MKNDPKAIIPFTLLVCLFLVFGYLRGNLSAQEVSLFDKPDVTISMDLKDASLKDILKVLSIQSGMNFIASEGVQDRTLTLYFDKVPLKEAVDKLFSANNLFYELDKGANILIVKDWGKPEIVMETRIFNLQYATVGAASLQQEMDSQLGSDGGGSEGGGESAAGAAGAAGGAAGGAAADEPGISGVVKKLLSSNGSMVEDSRTNSLIVRDIPSRLPVIAQTIAELDQSQPQVMLEVEMLDVSKSMLDKMGIKFGDMSASSPILSMLVQGAERVTSYPLSKYNVLFEDAKLTYGSVSFAGTQYNVLLDFIKSQADSKSLARPRLLTMNHQTAVIEITTDEVVGSPSSSISDGVVITGSPERSKTGVTLRVTPQINLKKNEITMLINPKVSAASTSSISANYKDNETRETKSLVRMRDGETIILGGLIRTEKAETVSSLPIFGDLPLVGRLFRHKNKSQDRQRELLVFITPHIMREGGFSGPAEKAVTLLLEREQSSMMVR